MAVWRCSRGRSTWIRCWPSADRRAGQVVPADFASPECLDQIGLDKLRAGVDVDLAQKRVAGVNESMRCVRRNDDDAAGFHLTLFLSDRDGRAAFECEC